MSIETILTEIIQREGKQTDDAVDNGDRTAYGISEKANPGAWADMRVTEEEARAIYRKKYVSAPRFDQVADTRLQAQLIDFGVHSGPYIAIQKLQEILHVTVDGWIGPETLGALGTVHSDDINNLLVAARVRMLGKIVSKNPPQIKFLNGWLNRALEFLV